jgi:3',5'-cyclic AMP phosphodiesterase CpdA
MRTIAQISDLHFGRHDRQIAEHLLASLARDRPDLVAVSGDLTQRARPAEFEAARRFLDRIDSRKLIVPGNHDVPLYDLFSRFGAPLKRFQQFIASTDVADGFYRDEEIAVLGLNTTRRFENKRGRLSLAQIDDIRRLFATLPSSVFKILMTHHPLGVPAGGPLFETARRGLLALAASSDIRLHLLLSGHRHSALSGNIDAEILQQGAILAVHAGTAISTRTRGGETNSYNLLRIDGGRIMVEVKAWAAGHGFKTARTTSYALESGRWHGVHHPVFAR